jgi:hypothetical protein
MLNANRFFKTLRALILLALLSLSFSAATWAQRFESQGSSYLVEKVPAWVIPRPDVPAKSTAATSSWHYALIDHQNLIAGAQTARFIHVIRKIDSATGLGEGTRF